MFWVKTTNEQIERSVHEAVSKHTLGNLSNYRLPGRHTVQLVIDHPCTAALDLLSVSFASWSLPAAGPACGRKRARLEQQLQPMCQRWGQQTERRTAQTSSWFNPVGTNIPYQHTLGPQWGHCRQHASPTVTPPPQVQDPCCSIADQLSALGAPPAHTIPSPSSP